MTTMLTIKILFTINPLKNEEEGKNLFIQNTIDKFLSI